MSNRTKETIKDIILAIVIAAEVFAGIHFFMEDRKAAEEIWIGSVPMANQKIEWTGAGYRGGN